MRADAPAYIMDSFALLAYLQDEAGGGLVAGVLERAEKAQARILMCIVNYGEALYILERENGLPDVQRAISAVDQLPITVVDAERTLTFAAAHVKAHYALSYADAFAVALAQRERAAVLTGDPEFKKAQGLITVKWLPRA